MSVLFIGLHADAHGVSASKFRTWHNTSTAEKLHVPRIGMKNVMKNDLPVLSDYRAPPSDDFWKLFPFRGVPLGPSTPIDVPAFKEIILKCRHRFNNFHDNLSRLVLDDLTFGADTMTQLEYLPPLTCVNPIDLSDSEVCAHLNDQICSWVKKGYVCGPFDDPPLANFRCNPLFAHVKRGKVRPILNLSAPEGRSYNDFIPKQSLLKINSATPRMIADYLYQLGPGCTLSKLDMEGAFKLIPVQPRFWRAQGFQWLGKYFFESQIVFGSSSGPSIYDRLHEVFLLTARTISSTFSPCFYRVLDDLVSVTYTREENEKLIFTYIRLADYIKLPLAPFADAEKAFLLKQSGTLLGIDFRTTDNCWKVPEEKSTFHIGFVQRLINKRFLSLFDMQAIAGMLVGIENMLPVVKPEFAPIKMALRAANFGPVANDKLLRSTLFKSLRILRDLQDWTPISPPLSSAPLRCFVLVSDAAGFSVDDKFQVGVGGVAYLVDMSQIVRFQHISWPDSFIHATDVNGIEFRHKTTLLEAIGALSLFMDLHRTLANQHFILKIDNKASVFAFQKGRSKRDPYCSVIVSAFNFLLVQLNARMDVVHLPRVSDEAAVWADHLSRKDDKGLEKFQAVSRWCCTSWPRSLERWLLDPSLDFCLGEKLLHDLCLLRS